MIHQLEKLFTKLSPVLLKVLKQYGYYEEPLAKQEDPREDPFQIEFYRLPWSAQYTLLQVLSEVDENGVASITTGQLYDKGTINRSTMSRCMTTLKRAGYVTVDPKAPSLTVPPHILEWAKRHKGQHKIITVLLSNP